MSAFYPYQPQAFGRRPNQKFLQLQKSNHLISWVHTEQHIDLPRLLQLTLHGINPEILEDRDGLESSMQLTTLDIIASDE